MKFNEDARVKIPTILHLTRLGYKYLSLKEHTWDMESNIFPEIFLESVSRINPLFEKDDIQRELQDLKLTLDNDDLGKVFFSKLINRSGMVILP
ncbi:MAG: hypothetical protein Q4B49_07065 [Acinetobacter sp.]|uniref:hypothetical protein n=1 Tax=Acinetobacter sp. TaxID=472 RepID=UPI0015D34B7F|nr:hypothetical protein [Acinetobacter sp.]MDO4579789.1 hypothetical protein [Acinetobacter sp.]